MRILFTGCTAKQTDDNAYKRARVKRIDDSSIICNSLRKQGYEVDRRKVKWGDNLSDYGLAIVGLGQFGSNNYSGEIFNALYAIQEVENVLIFHEDWKIKGTIDSFTKMLDKDILIKTIVKKWSDGRHFYGGVDNINFDIDKAHKVISNITNGLYDALIPAFDWGDKAIVRNIIKSKNIYNLDLTPYVLSNWLIPLNVEKQEKKRKHMLASLVDHRSWVKRNKLKWDVDYFGAKSIKEAPQLKTEKHVFEECGKYWSILCPEYPHSGSGWFRVRWIYAAIHKSILYSCENDCDALGLDNINIENLNENELKQYAEKQSKAILKHMWNIETFDKKIHNIVNKKCKTLTKHNRPTLNKAPTLFYP